MIEIRTDKRDGSIICTETELIKGTGTIWYFSDLQNYVIKYRTDINKNVLHHLCQLSIEQMEAMKDLELKDSELIRLCSDLERLIKHLYYPETEREYDVKLIGDYLEFREEGLLIQKITYERFEKDLKYDPDTKTCAMGLINFALEGRRLSDIERSKLADKLVEIYNDVTEARISEDIEKKKAKKNKKHENDDE